MIDTLTALAEPNRFAIVELLRAGPRSVNDIVEALGLRQPLVSKHLKVLSTAGVVAVCPRAQQRIYSLEERAFRDLERWLDAYIEMWGDRFDRLESHLAGEDRS